MLATHQWCPLRKDKGRGRARAQSNVRQPGPGCKADQLDTDVSEAGVNRTGASVRIDYGAG